MPANVGRGTGHVASKGSQGQSRDLNCDLFLTSALAGHLAPALPPASPGEHPQPCLTSRGRAADCWPRSHLV